MIVKIAWKNIIHKPFNTALCIGLLTFGVGIITLLLLMQHQKAANFYDSSYVIGGMVAPIIT